jgi:hypothetical protein
MVRQNSLRAADNGGDGSRWLVRVDDKSTSRSLSNQRGFLHGAPGLSRDQGPLRTALVRREIVWHRCVTAARQGSENPGQGYDYQPGKGYAHVANSRLGGRPQGATQAEVAQVTGRRSLPPGDAVIDIELEHPAEPQ